MPRKYIKDYDVPHARECPFCGLRDVEAAPLFSERTQLIGVYITCRTCGARGPLVKLIKTKAGKPLKEKTVAFAVWNWNGKVKRRFVTDSGPWPGPEVIPAGDVQIAEAVPDAAEDAADANSTEEAGADAEPEPPGSAEGDAVGADAIETEAMPNYANQPAGDADADWQPAMPEYGGADTEADGALRVQPAGPVDPPDVVEAERREIQARALLLQAEAAFAGKTIAEYIAREPIPPMKF